jgi:RNA recognition motif-containing protein
LENKLYVGNLAYSITSAALADLFSQAGIVKSAIVITERETGRSKGFGFVEMGSAAEAEKAIHLFHNYRLENRALVVNVARPREKRGPGGRSDPPYDHSGGRGRDHRSSYGNDRDSGGQRR